MGDANHVLIFGAEILFRVWFLIPNYTASLQCLHPEHYNECCLVGCLLPRVWCRREGVGVGLESEVIHELVRCFGARVNEFNNRFYGAWLARTKGTITTSTVHVSSIVNLWPCWWRDGERKRGGVVERGRRVQVLLPPCYGLCYFMSLSSSLFKFCTPYPFNRSETGEKEWNYPFPRDTHTLTPPSTYYACMTLESCVISMKSKLCYCDLVIHQLLKKKIQIFGL